MQYISSQKSMTAVKPILAISEGAIVLLSLDCFCPYILVECSDAIRQTVLSASRLITEKLIIPRHLGASNASRSHDQSIQAALFEVLGRECIEHLPYLKRRLLCYEQAYRCESFLRLSSVQAALVKRVRMEVSSILVDFLALSDQLYESVQEEVLEALLMVPNPPWISSPVTTVSATNLFDNVSHLSSYANATDWDQWVERNLDEAIVPSLVFSFVFQSNSKLSFLESWRLAMGSERYSRFVEALTLEFFARGGQPNKSFSKQSELQSALSLYTFESCLRLDLE